MAITVADTTTVSETVPAALSGNENTAISLSGILGVGWSEHRRPAEHDADGVARHHHGGHDERRDHRRGTNGSGSVTLSGTAAADRRGAGEHDANYTGNLNYYGPDSLSVTTTDTNNGATSGTKTVAITVADTTTVSETVPASLSGNENTAISLSGISVSDGPNTADTLTTTLTVSHGTITVGTTSGATIVAAPTAAAR